MIQFNKLLQEQFNKMCATGKLFKVAMTGQEVWDLYLKSFPDGMDPIFRDPLSSEHNCNHCNNFVRRYGNIVAIKSDNTLMTLFDVEAQDEFSEVAKVLSKAISKSTVKEVFFETFNELNNLPYEKCSSKNEVFRLGIDRNTKRYTKEEAEKYGVVKADELRTFNHMYLDIPKMYVDSTGKSVESIMGEFRDAKNVFQRAMEEISLDTYELVRDLILQDSLLDGQTHLHKIEQMIPLKKVYNDLSKKERDNWCWVTSFKLPFAKFRNELMGTLCSELSSGEDLNKACMSWNKRVDPINYMKTTAPITQKQIGEARQFVEENGYTQSFDRRMATIDDIKASEIKHMNIGEDKVKALSVFDNVQATKVSQHKRNEFDNVEEVGIEKFMSDILPSCTAVELFVMNHHEGNFVSLTTSADPNSKPIFKWPNNYSQTFNGNLAGKSQLAQMVESKGGRTDGVFRFTHSWNEIEPNQSLMDLHVFMPGCGIPNSGGGPNVSGRRVGWNNRQDGLSGGIQDVDYTSEAPKGYIPVENITFPELGKMPDGVYTCKIHNWSFRKSGGRGRAEIAFAGNVFQYEYPATKNHEWITVAEVTLKKGVFTIEHKLPLTGEQVRDIYNLKTGQFHKVNLICLSPNHWEAQVGNKYYLFMLDKCKAPGPIRGFHNENLIPELLAHKKVMEVLGSTTNVESTDKQLSGLGFNATVRDEVIAKLSGNFKRTIKIKF